jgi:hypothetical protein
MGSRELQRVAMYLGLIAIASTSACKPSRSPREVSGDDVTGSWRAKSPPAKGTAGDSTEWRLELEQHAGGRMDGRGSAQIGGSVKNFDLSGRRDAHRLVIEFRLDGDHAAIVAAVNDPQSISGMVELKRDTIPVTFTRP